MNQHLNPKAVKKAMRAAGHLAKAARLMREAASMSDGTIASEHGDFLAWAHQIEELISCDGGEGGIGPNTQRMLESGGLPKTKVKTYPHRRSDGRVVNVTVPEKETER
jgi:hypothetical protein